MRIPPDPPVRLPPRVETPVALSDAISAEAPDWESAADALDAAPGPAADDHDNAQDHEHDESSGRRQVAWPQDEEQSDAPTAGLELARRPELANGFWVLPDQRPYPPHVHAPRRSPLVTEPAPALSTDFAGRRHGRRDHDDRDDDAPRPAQLHRDDSGADDPGHDAG